MNFKPLTLVGLISCSAYPSDANLKIEADSVRYSIYGENNEVYSELGMLNNPDWLYDLRQEIKVQITLEQENPQILYDGFFLNETGKRATPYLEELLEKGGVIGAYCGFHHPDSHDPCYAGVKVSEPVTLVYRITSFPGEKNTEDNQAIVTFSLEDLQSHAHTLSSVWHEQDRKEVEEELKEIAEKSRGWK